jgi:hypothetical protein
MALRESSPSTRPVRTTRGRLTYCSWRRPAMRLPSVARDTNRPCAATTAETSALAPSRLVTSSCAGSSPERGSTSSHPCGKALSGLPMSPDRALLGWRRRKEFLCLTHGTSNTSASSTRDPHAYERKWGCTCPGDSHCVSLMGPRELPPTPKWKPHAPRWRKTIEPRSCPCPSGSPMLRTGGK